MKITDFDSSAAVMSLNWQIRLRRHRQIAFNLILLLLSFLEGNMAEYSKEIQHRQLMRRPSSCPYPSAVFFFFSTPSPMQGQGAREPRCVGSPCHREATVSFPHQSRVWFSSSLKSACKFTDPPKQVFVSHNTEGETTVPHLS